MAGQLAFQLPLVWMKGDPAAVHQLLQLGSLPQSFLLTKHQGVAALQLKLHLAFLGAAHEQLLKAFPDLYFPIDHHVVLLYPFAISNLSQVASVTEQSFGVSLAPVQRSPGGALGLWLSLEAFPALVQGAP